MSKSIKGYRKPTHDEIAAYAQRLYEAEGRPDGKAVEHWLNAEAQLIAQRKAETQPAAKNAGKPNAAWETPAPRQQGTNLHRN